MGAGHTRWFKSTQQEIGYEGPDLPADHHAAAIFHEKVRSAWYVDEMKARRMEEYLDRRWFYLIVGHYGTWVELSWRGFKAAVDDHQLALNFLAILTNREWAQVGKETL